MKQLDYVSIDKKSCSDCGKKFLYCREGEMGKRKIKILKSELLFLEDNKVYKVVKGKVLIKNIFPNGKVVSNEAPLERGGIIGNFFKIYKVYENIAKDIAIEIEALEDTEILVSDEKELLRALENDTFGMMENLINQMLKKHLINIFHHGYSKKGYLLVVLLLNSDTNGKIDKEFLNYEFFATISELKKDCIIVKKSRGFEINRKEAEKFLELETY